MQICRVPMRNALCRLSGYYRGNVWRLHDKNSSMKKCCRVKGIEGEHGGKIETDCLILITSGECSCAVCRKSDGKNLILCSGSSFWVLKKCFDIPQSFTKYFGQILVFMWNKALWKKFNSDFSSYFASIEKYIFGGRPGARL